MSSSGRDSPLIFAPNSDSEEWLHHWQRVLSRDVIDSPVIPVDADLPVDDAAQILLKVTSPCLAVRHPANSASDSPYLGLLDCADLTAYLALVSLAPSYPADLDPSIAAILAALRDPVNRGTVPVSLISNLSEKNPLISLPETATLIHLLEVFSNGVHHVLIHSASTQPQKSYLGLVSSRALLAHFDAHARQSPPLYQFLCNQLHSLSLKSLALGRNDMLRAMSLNVNRRNGATADPDDSEEVELIACSSDETVLDAIRKMVAFGVGSVAVLQDETGVSAHEKLLLSSVSCVDVARLVIPSPDKSILSESLHQFVGRVKAQDGVTDGADRYPIYSVSAASTLGFAMEKLLATTAHRIYVTEGSGDSEISYWANSHPNNHNADADELNNAGVSPISPVNVNAAANSDLRLRGVVSIVDVLALFAQLAKIPDVDPAQLRTRSRRRMEAVLARAQT